jgi:hypothetical protein
MSIGLSFKSLFFFFFFFLIEMMGNLVVVLICVWSLILIGLIFFFGHSIMEEV